MGNEFIGIFSQVLKDEEFDSYVITINMFPITIYLQAHYNLNHYEIKIEIFKKISFGIFVND